MPENQVGTHSKLIKFVLHRCLLDNIGFVLFLSLHKGLLSDSQFPHFLNFQFLLVTLFYNVLLLLLNGVVQTFVAHVQRFICKK